jgi:small subunit ribosomal protein S4e
MHLKRQKIPKNWPIPRKGTKYVVRPNYNIKEGVPILIILRDILKLAQNRKEVKKVIHLKHILLNNKVVIDEKNNALLFDTITIIPSKKYYRIELSEKGKFYVKEIKETETNKKISKIIDKKILKGKKTQLNLSDGRNFISDIKCNVRDSVLLNFKSKKIEKCLPLKEKAKVIVFGGKHSGKKGIIKKINTERKIVELNIDKETINVLIKQLMVIE